MARKVGEHFERSAVAWWCHGNGDVVEWSEWKGDYLYNAVELYEKEAIKSTDQLYELIKSLGVPLTLHSNWRDMEMLGPQFLRLL